MDGQVIFGVIGATGTLVGLGVVIGRTRTLSGAVIKDLKTLDAQVHKHANRLQYIPEKPDDVYARKDAIAPKLEAIDASLKRIEAHQDMMAQRFMNGGAGSGVA